MHQYDWGMKCDHHVKLFLHSIHTIQACSTPQTKFNALVITKVDNPRLPDQMWVRIQKGDHLVTKFNADIVGRDQAKIYG